MAAAVAAVSLRGQLMAAPTRPSGVTVGAAAAEVVVDNNSNNIFGKTTEICTGIRNPNSTTKTLQRFTAVMALVLEEEGGPLAVFDLAALRGPAVAMIATPCTVERRTPMAELQRRQRPPQPPQPAKAPYSTEIPPHILLLEAGARVGVEAAEVETPEIATTQRPIPWGLRRVRVVVVA